VAPRRFGDAVVYQVYPRSFQDSDGDGVGDLGGILGRLDHLTWLGVDALWLSPIHPSPNADWGYDIADYDGIAAELGTLEDFDRLVEGCHARGLRLLLDLVPSHTSIAHPWFREHPERYCWHDGPSPPNNWRATFGGPAWSRDPMSGRWYLHSYYPEQPDLDWSRPDVVEAMQAVIRGWRERGADGFRIDACTRIAKDPERRDDPPRTTPSPFNWHPEYGALDHVRSKDGPGIGAALAAIREAAGDAPLVAEATLPNEQLGRYLEHVDACFAFELQAAAWTAPALNHALGRALELEDGLAWVLGNHDVPRLASRVGPERAAAAAVLLLTLPGPVFVYQGDELGLADGPAPGQPLDRAGRDGARTGIPWQAGAAHAGFTTGEPWLPVAEPSGWAGGTAAEQRSDGGSHAALHRDVIALRRELSGPATTVDLGPDTVAFARGDAVVAIRPDGGPVAAPEGRLLLRTARGDGIVVRRA
jgi:alpha-glucosidase